MGGSALSTQANAKREGIPARRRSLAPQALTLLASSALAISLALPLAIYHGPLASGPPSPLWRVLVFPPIDSGHVLALAILFSLASLVVRGHSALLARAAFGLAALISLLATSLVFDLPPIWGGLPGSYLQPASGTLALALGMLLQGLAAAAPRRPSAS